MMLLDSFIQKEVHRVRKFPRPWALYARKVPVSVIESSPEPSHSHKRKPRPRKNQEDWWGTTARGLHKLFGNTKGKFKHIREMRKPLRQEPLEAKLRLLARECGMNFKLFATVVAILLVEGPEYLSLLVGALERKRGKTYTQSIRTNLMRALDLYRETRQ